MRFTTVFPALAGFAALSSAAPTSLKTAEQKRSEDIAQKEQNDNTRIQHQKATAESTTVDDDQPRVQYVGGGVHRPEYVPGARYPGFKRSEDGHYYPVPGHGLQWAPGPDNWQGQNQWQNGNNGQLQQQHAQQLQDLERQHEQQRQQLDWEHQNQQGQQQWQKRDGNYYIPGGNPNWQQQNQLNRDQQNQDAQMSRDQEQQRQQMERDQRNQDIQNQQNQRNQEIQNQQNLQNQQAQRAQQPYPVKRDDNYYIPGATNVNWQQHDQLNRDQRNQRNQMLRDQEQQRQQMNRDQRNQDLQNQRVQHPPFGPVKRDGNYYGPGVDPNAELQRQHELQRQQLDQQHDGQRQQLDWAHQNQQGQQGRQWYKRDEGHYYPVPGHGLQWAPGPANNNWQQQQQWQNQNQWQNGNNWQNNGVRYQKRGEDGHYYPVPGHGLQWAPGPDNNNWQQQQQWQNQNQWQNGNNWQNNGVRYQKRGEDGHYYPVPGHGLQWAPGPANNNWQNQNQWQNGNNGQGQQQWQGQNQWQNGNNGLGQQQHEQQRQALEIQHQQQRQQLQQQHQQQQGQQQWQKRALDGNDLVQPYLDNDNDGRHSPLYVTVSSSTQKRDNALTENANGNPGAHPVDAHPAGAPGAPHYATRPGVPQPQAKRATNDKENINPIAFEAGRPGFQNNVDYNSQTQSQRTANTNINNSNNKEIGSNDNINILNK